ALELRAALAPKLPLVVCVSTTDGSGEDRGRVEETLLLLRTCDEDVEIGMNCCRGPHELFKVALSQPELPRWLKPSRGQPNDMVADSVMAGFARAARRRGARGVGGCCGSDAGTVTLMGSALRGRPASRSGPSAARPPPPPAPPPHP